MKFHSAAQLASDYQKKFTAPAPGTVDLQASGSDPYFGSSETVEGIQAASVLNFNSAGKLKTAKATSHFLVGGNTVLAGDLVELPETEFKRMGPDGTGQVVEATDADIAAAKKASK